MEQIWFPLIGFEGKYEITKTGKVRSLYKRHYERELKQRIDRAGYVTVRLSKNGFGSSYFLHRLLGLTFIPNPENKPWINHKNCITTENSLDNLEWSTPSENMQHAHDNGLICKDKTSKKVLDINTGVIYVSIKEAAKTFKINYKALVNYLKGNRSNPTQLRYAE